MVLVADFGIKLFIFCLFFNFNGNFKFKNIQIKQFKQFPNLLHSNPATPTTTKFISTKITITAHFFTSSTCFLPL
jgi:hypothetical protein